MKQRVNITLEIDENDLFEAEVKKAIHDYAKSVAREEIQKEIQDEIERVAADRARQLKNSSSWSPSKLEKMVKAQVDDSVAKLISNSNPVAVELRAWVDNAIEQQKQYTQERVKDELDRAYESIDLSKLIEDSIKESVPKEVLKVLVSCIKKSEE